MTSQASPYTQWATTTTGEFIHLRMLGDPMIILHVALNPGNVAENVDTLVRHREQRRPEVREESRAAIFFSVTSTQAGLKGIELVTHQIKQAVTRLHEEFSAMKSYPRSPPSPAHCHQPTNCDRL